MNYESTKLVRRYAMEYGTFLGIAWIVDFFCIVMGINGNEFMSLIGFFLLLALPIFTFYLAFRFRRQECCHPISLSTGAYFTFLLFLYAQLICFIVEYAYFELIDNGQLISAFATMFEDARLVEEYKRMGMSNILITAKEQLNELASLSTFDISISLLGSNILTSIILFLPTWLVAGLSSQNKQSSNNSYTR